MSRRIYIAGPMRAEFQYGFPVFDAARDKLQAEGWEVVSPADLDRANGFDATILPDDTDWNQFPDGPTQDTVINRCLSAIFTCDAMYMLPGWDHSKGALTEKALAEFRGMEIIYAGLRKTVEPCTAVPVEDPPADPACFQTPLIDKMKASRAKLVEDGITPVGSIGRTFESGAYRDANKNKLNYDGFLDPGVLKAYAEYMHKNRIQSNGVMRDAGNWKLGIDRLVYRESAWRHFMAWWEAHQKGEATLEHACALMFNIMGDMYESLRPPKDT